MRHINSCTFPPDYVINLHDLPERRRDKPLPVGTRVLVDVDARMANINNTMVAESNGKEARILSQQSRYMGGGKYKLRYVPEQGYAYDIGFADHNADRPLADWYEDTWQWRDHHLLVVTDATLKKTKPDLPDV